jgi:hypothetical protein
MAKQQEIGYQEGSRWINRRPAPEELARWFQENVQIHDGLSHRDYLPGITLIPNREKVKEVRVDQAGNPQIVEVEQLAYAPYPKVEARIAYFWSLMRLHPEWLGRIKLVPVEPVKTLPPGFFQMPVPDATGQKMTLFLGVSYQVEITERRSGKAVIEPAGGTKMVPLLKKGYGGVYYPDPDAVHKAQTSAQGRALGYAGMLVVSGSGIATAEDMADFIAGEPPAPSLPPVEEPSPVENGAIPPGLAELVATQRAKLEAEFPQSYEEARAWAHEKGFDLGDPPAHALRGLELQLRRKLAAAQAAGARPSG